MNVKYEIYVPKKAEGIWHLLLEVMTNDLKFPNGAIEYFSLSFSDQHILKRIKSTDTPVFVIRKKGQIAGVFVGSKPEGGVGTIIWLIVSSKFRGTGLGKALLESAFEAYRSMGCHKVKLTAQTPMAVNFYVKHGMVVEGQHRNHWWNMDFTTLAKFLS